MPQPTQTPDVEMLSQPAPVVQSQPVTSQPMDASQPHPEQTREQMTLRGGNDGRGPCPGRFCFIIPCPIPCNFCVFPCPC